MSGRGKPKAGFRKTRAWYERQGLALPEHMKRGDRAPSNIVHLRPAESSHRISFSDKIENRIQDGNHTVLPAPMESEADVRRRIAERFRVLDILTQDAINGDARALIVSGPAGVGKSYSVEQALADADVPSKIVKGYVKTTGLYKSLYEMRHPGNVIVYDDADSVFEEVTALNLLKAACDTTSIRTLSYHSEANMSDEEGMRLPREFVFEGTIIFISNLDFDTMIAKGNKLAPHLEALVSRAHYISLGMHSPRDVFIRIKDMLRSGMIPDLSRDQVEDMIRFFTDNLPVLRKLSLRTAVLLAPMMKRGADWETVARVTLCKG